MDEAAFREFFDQQADGIRRFAYFLTADADRAADLAQEALVRTFAAWRRVRDGNPGGYARRTVVNLCRNEHRRASVRLRARPRGPETRSPDETASVDEGLRLLAALRALTPVQRAAVVLRYYEDLTEADVSRILGRPLGTVKSDLHRGLARLRPLLEENAREST